MIEPRVADLTVSEFREMVRAIVLQTMLELLGDPDAGLELREEFAESLRRSIAAVQAGGETIPAEAVAERLGLEW
jgi:hypothetical protein